MSKDKDNPWLVDNIQAFSYLNCPECDFKVKEEILFQYHALKNHPKSTAFFGSDSKIEHVEEVTIEEEKKSDEEKCDFCDFASKDRASLVHHIRKEHLEFDEITGLDAPCISGKDPLKESPKKGRASISIEDMIEGKNFSHFPSISVHFHTCSGRP